MDTQALWTQSLELLKAEVTSANFATWFKDVSVSHEDHGVLYVCVLHEFTRDWFKSRFEKTILKCVRTVNPEIRSIEIMVSSKTQPLPQRQQVTVVRPPSLPEFSPSNGFGAQIDNLNPRLTFESLVVGPFNEVAFTAAQGVVRQPGVFNPLYIYGSTGLGKTHLMQAIGNAMKRTNQQLKICYVTSEKFANDYIGALSNNSINNFKENYRKYDLLIMDDIQFFSGKERIQEEFFHLYNSLQQKGGQLVFSSDKHPAVITGLEERLRSRLGAGMVVDVSEPEYESKVAIIRAKQNQLGVLFDPEAVDFIAQNSVGSIRELEGVIHTLMNLSLLRKAPVSVADARNTLKHSTKMRKQVSIEDVVRICAEYFHLSPDLIYESTRRKEVVHARQTAMYLLREDYNISFPMIGKELGNRDHTTVIHSYDKIGKEKEANPNVQAELDSIRQILKNA